MRKLVYFVGLCLVMACNQRAESNKEIGSAELITEQEALDLLHTWTKAYLEGNSVRLNDVIDDSWLYSGSADGSTSNKAQTIEEFSKADYSFDDITYEDLDVRLYEDVAVVRGKERMVILGSSKQDTTILSLRFTDVYQKKDGKIRAISTHSSPIE